MVSGDLPLDGVRVVDLTRFVSGAYAGRLLAALGADVIKVELPETGDPYREQGTAFVGDESALFGALNCGKRSILIDLAADEGRAQLDALLETADVFLENGRPGALAKLGLDAASVAARFPHVVYGSISGYGQSGPDAGRGGFDLILQAEGGLMSVTGEPDSGPVKVGVPALDIGSAVSCALGVVSALYARNRTGRGARVAASLLEFAVASFTSVAPSYFVDGEVPGRIGSHSPTFAPYGAFRAKDGHLVIAGAGSEALWQRLCEALDAPELADDPRFADNAARVRNRSVLTDELEARLRRCDRAHWLSRLDAARVPAAEVRDLAQVLDSAQVRHLGLVQADPGAPAMTPVLGVPLQVDGPLPSAGRWPRLGEHTEEILAELRTRPGAR